MAGVLVLILVCAWEAEASRRSGIESLRDLRLDEGPPEPTGKSALFVEAGRAAASLPSGHDPRRGFVDAWRRDFARRRAETTSPKSGVIRNPSSFGNAVLLEVPGAASTGSVDRAQLTREMLSEAYGISSSLPTEQATLLRAMQQHIESEGRALSDANVASSGPPVSSTLAAVLTRGAKAPPREAHKPLRSADPAFDTNDVNGPEQCFSCIYALERLQQLVAPVRRHGPVPRRRSQLEGEVNHARFPGHVAEGSRPGAYESSATPIKGGQTHCGQGIPGVPGSRPDCRPRPSEAGDSASTAINRESAPVAAAVSAPVAATAAAKPTSTADAGTSDANTGLPAAPHASATASGAATPTAFLELAEHTRLSEEPPPAYYLPPGVRAFYAAGSFGRWGAGMSPTGSDFAIPPPPPAPYEYPFDSNSHPPAPPLRHPVLSPELVVGAVTSSARRLSESDVLDPIDADLLVHTRPTYDWVPLSALSAAVAAGQRRYRGGSPFLDPHIPAPSISYPRAGQPSVHPFGGSVGYGGLPLTESGYPAPYAYASAAGMPISPLQSTTARPIIPGDEPQTLSRVVSGNSRSIGDAESLWGRLAGQGSSARFAASSGTASDVSTAQNAQNEVWVEADVIEPESSGGERSSTPAAQAQGPDITRYSRKRRAQQHHLGERISPSFVRSTESEGTAALASALPVHLTGTFYRLAETPSSADAGADVVSQEAAWDIAEASADASSTAASETVAAASSDAADMAAAWATAEAAVEVDAASSSPGGKRLSAAAESGVLSDAWAGKAGVGGEPSWDDVRGMLEGLEDTPAGSRPLPPGVNFDMDGGFVGRLGSTAEMATVERSLERLRRRLDGADTDPANAVRDAEELAHSIASAVTAADAADREEASKWAAGVLSVAAGDADAAGRAVVRHAAKHVIRGSALLPPRHVERAAADAAALDAVAALLLELHENGGGESVGTASRDRVQLVDSDPVASPTLGEAATDPRVFRDTGDAFPLAAPRARSGGPAPLSPSPDHSSPPNALFGRVEDAEAAAAAAAAEAMFDALLAQGSPEQSREDEETLPLWKQRDRDAAAAIERRWPTPRSSSRAGDGSEAELAIAANESSPYAQAAGPSDTYNLWEGSADFISPGNRPPAGSTPEPPLPQPSSSTSGGGSVASLLKEATPSATSGNGRTSALHALRSAAARVAQAAARRLDPRTQVDPLQAQREAAAAVAARAAAASHLPAGARDIGGFDADPVFWSSALKGGPLEAAALSGDARLADGDGSRVVDGRLSASEAAAAVQRLLPVADSKAGIVGGTGRRLLSLSRRINDDPAVDLAKSAVSRAQSTLGRAAGLAAKAGAVAVSGAAAAVGAAFGAATGRPLPHACQPGEPFCRQRHRQPSLPHLMRKRRREEQRAGLERAVVTYAAALERLCQRDLEGVGARPSRAVPASESRMAGYPTLTPELRRTRGHFVDEWSHVREKTRAGDDVGLGTMRRYAFPEPVRAFCPVLRVRLAAAVERLLHGYDEEETCVALALCDEGQIQGTFRPGEPTDPKARVAGAAAAALGGRRGEDVA